MTPERLRALRNTSGFGAIGLLVFLASFVLSLP
jgi:hypothetical protein